MARVSTDRKSRWIYIFCEGKTEESYFKKIKTIYRNTGLNIKTVDLEGGTKIMDHPERIKGKIEGTLRKDSPRLGGLSPTVFIIFDLDIFLDKAKIDHMLCVLGGYNPTASNMTFEYWILSHFQEYNLSNGKRHYLQKLKIYLPSLPDMPDLRSYKMTDGDFEWLDKERITTAVANVKKVNISHGNLKDRDPYSDVYKVIEYLQDV